VHRHRLLWEEADIFTPERFAKERERTIPPGAFVPFAWGPRVCTGRALALTEIPFLIAEIARRYDIQVENPQEVRPISRLTIMPATEIRCRFVPWAA
jgi:cytochrome P450